MHSKLFLGLVSVILLGAGCARGGAPGGPAGGGSGGVSQPSAPSSGSARVGAPQCERNGGYDSDCVFSLAISERNASICNVFGRGSTFASACITNYAKQTGDRSACDLITQSPVLVENCKQQ